MLAQTTFALVALISRAYGQAPMEDLPAYGDQGNQGNQAPPPPAQTPTKGVSFPCQNARDAVVAGSAIAHQLLAIALQMTPEADTVVVQNIEAAQTTLAKAQMYVANLAMATAAQGPAQGADLQQLGFGVTDALRSLKEAQVAAKKLNLGNINIGLNSSETLESSFMSQMPLVTANGPVIVSNQVSSTLASPSENIMAQASLQLQTVNQALAYGQSCVSDTPAEQPVPEQPAMPFPIPGSNETAPEIPNQGQNNQTETPSLPPITTPAIEPDQGQNNHTGTPVLPPINTPDPEESPAPPMEEQPTPSDQIPPVPFPTSGTPETPAEQPAAPTPSVTLPGPPGYYGRYWRWPRYGGRNRRF